MKKKICLSLLWCLVLTLQFFFSCTNEDEASVNIASGLETSADLLKLVDNGTFIAGELSITSDVPDVKLVWNTNEACNLDTTISSITVKNGRYILPIKWQKSISDGKFGPEGIAYKAGVQIMAGKYSKYVPLIWAEKVDTTKVMESIPATRAVESIMPRVVQIVLTPLTAYMNDQIGVSVHVGLNNVEFVVFDWSEFNSDTNIDTSLLPNYITSSQFIDFKWTSNRAPSYGFSVKYNAHTEGFTQSGTVRYDPPALTYMVNFRASTGGTVSQTSGSGSLNKTVSSTASPNKDYSFDGWYDIANNTKVSSNMTLSVILNENVNKKTYEARFIDSRDYVECAGIKWSKGNLQYINGTYSFMDGQELGSILGDTGINVDRFAFNTLFPGWKYTSGNNGDPCTKVKPVGTWRTPNSDEFLKLQKSHYVYGYCNGIYGIYYGITSSSSIEEKSRTLFLPMPPYRNLLLNKYWSTTRYSDQDGEFFFVTEDQGGFVTHHVFANKDHIRCVRNK